MVYTADSIRKFDSKSNRTVDSIRDWIRTQKNDSQLPSLHCCCQYEKYVMSDEVNCYALMHCDKSQVITQKGLNVRWLRIMTPLTLANPR